MSSLNLSYDAPVAHITIARPEKRNAFTQDMWQHLYSHCEKIDSELVPKVTVVQAQGDVAFCAGADIQELRSLMLDKQALKTNNEIVTQAQLRLARLKSASIAAVQGACVGGGLGIALACDFRICTKDSKFAITPAKLGLIYSIEDTRRLVNIIGLARAKEMLLLGKQIDATTALNWGLVHSVVDTDALRSSCQELIEQLSKVSRHSIDGLKQTIDFVSGQSALTEQHVRDYFTAAFDHADFAEGASAFLEKRAARFS